MDFEKIRANARRIYADPAVHFIVLWAIYMKTRRSVWGGITALSAGNFEGPSIVVRAIQNPIVAGTFAAIVVVAVACFRWRWTDLEFGKRVRVMFSILALLWVWLTVFMPFNLLFDQGYYFDRFLIAVAAALTIWRPAFAPFLLWISLLFVAQQIPSIERGLNWTEKRAFLDVQIAFASWLIVRRIFKASTGVWLLFACAIVASGYWVPFLNKLRIGDHFWSWALYDHLGNLFVASHVDGFLPHAGDGGILSFAAFLNAISPVLCVGTLLVEASGLLLFAHWKPARFVFIACIGMHIGIFVSSGIFFYKWIAVDIGLFYVFFKQGREIYADPAWRWWMRAAAAAVVIFSPITLEPYELGWWDTRLSQVVRVEAVLKDGTVREVAPLQMKPYDLPFVQGKIRYALDVPTIVGALGSVSKQPEYRRLEKLDADGFKRQLDRTGSGLVAPKAEKMDRFVSRFFANANKYEGKPPLWWLPGPPAHIWHGAVEKQWGGETVTKIQFRSIDVVYDPVEKKLTTIGDQIAHEIPISTAASPSHRPKTTKTTGKNRVGGPLHARAAGPALDRGSEMTWRDACTAKDDDVVTLAILGDFAVHRPLHIQAFEKGWGSLLDGIKPLVSAADLAWMNVEGVMSCCQDFQQNELPDPGAKFDGKVYTSGDDTGLNYHKSMAGALKDMGIDVAATVNNHSLDRHKIGVVKTIEALDEVGIKHTGTRASDSDPWYTVTTTKGMSIAWLGCTLWVNVKNSPAAENVLMCKTGGSDDPVIDMVRALAKEHDAVMFLIQGGKEEQLVADEALRALAEKAAEAGATAVITYHPHAMQTWQKFTTSDGREVPFMWCRGNNLTFVDWLEAVVSDINYVALAKSKDAKDGKGKARVVGSVHVPILIENKGGERHVLPVDFDSPQMAPAASVALAHWGRTRMRPPRVPVDVRPECHGAAPAEPWQSGSGDPCTVDAECAAPLACVESGANKFCTQKCAADADCPAAPGNTAICAEDPSWPGQTVCLRGCRDDEDNDCITGSGCALHGERFACGPGEEPPRLKKRAAAAAKPKKK